MSAESGGQAADGALLAVRDLSVDFQTDQGVLHAVRGVSFAVTPGETLAVVGESGAGKSVTALAVMGLLPPGAEVTGSVRFRGRELVGTGGTELTQLRGREMAVIFQDPTTSLNPVRSVGWQLAEAMRAHNPVSRKAAAARAVELLDLVGIPEPVKRSRGYPHEFSGGMRQRVLIAMAIANDPEVVFADEPTTALDVTVQGQVLETLDKVRAETGAAIVLITHDLGVVARMAERVMVMYAGRVVEVGAAEDIYHRPRMPYTQCLLRSIPRLDVDDRPLAAIPGSPPSLMALPPGCPFWPRCPSAAPLCRESEPELSCVGGGGHRAACHLAVEMAGEGRAPLA